MSTEGKAIQQQFNLSDVSGPDPKISREEFFRWPLAIVEMDEQGPTCATLTAWLTRTTR